MSLFSRRTSGMELLFRLISLLACSGFVWERAGQKLTSPVSSSTAKSNAKRQTQVSRLHFTEGEGSGRDTGVPVQYW